MTQDEILEALHKVVQENKHYTTWTVSTPHLVALVKLAIEHEREKYKWDIHSCSPTCNRYVCVAKREAVLAEREACANTAGLALLGADKALSDRVLKAIRARGQA